MSLEVLSRGAGCQVLWPLYKEQMVRREDWKRSYCKPGERGEWLTRRAAEEGRELRFAIYSLSCVFKDLSLSLSLSINPATRFCTLGCHHSCYNGKCTGASRYMCRKALHHSHLRGQPHWSWCHRVPLPDAGHNIPLHTAKLLSNADRAQDDQPAPRPPGTTAVPSQDHGTPGISQDPGRKSETHILKERI